MLEAALCSEIHLEVGRPARSARAGAFVVCCAMST